MNKTDLSCNPRTVPDGGWGWLVSVASFFVQLIVLGLQNIVDLLSAALLADFRKSKFQTGKFFFAFAQLMFHITVSCNATDKAEFKEIFLLVLI